MGFEPSTSSITRDGQFGRSSSHFFHRIPLHEPAASRPLTAGRGRYTSGQSDLRSALAEFDDVLPQVVPIDEGWRATSQAVLQGLRVEHASKMDESVTECGGGFGPILQELKVLRELARQRLRALDKDEAPHI